MGIEIMDRRYIWHTYLHKVIPLHIATNEQMISNL
jgi:hypothetical protein